MGVPSVVGMRLGGVSPARITGSERVWETRFLCSMKEGEMAVTGRGSFWDESRSGNSALLRAVRACYVQCSSDAYSDGLAGIRRL